jgi:hypothetical protein
MRGGQMKFWLRLSIGVLYFLFLGAIIVRPDFSSSDSAFPQILNWAIRLLVAIGFTAVSLLLIHVLKAETAERYQLIDGADRDRELNLSDAQPTPFEEIPPQKSTSSLWSPSNLILFLYCVALLSLVVHSAILCEILWIPMVVFLWMPNPWQGSANQPDKYEITPRNTHL